MCTQIYLFEDLKLKDRLVSSRDSLHYRVKKTTARIDWMSGRIFFLNIADVIFTLHPLLVFKAGERFELALQVWRKKDKKQTVKHCLLFKIETDQQEIRFIMCFSFQKNLTSW